MLRCTPKPTSRRKLCDITRAKAAERGGDCVLSPVNQLIREITRLEAELEHARKLLNLAILQEKAQKEALEKKKGTASGTV